MDERKYTQEFLDWCSGFAWQEAPQGSPQAACDINGDGVIEPVYDLAYIAKNLGKAEEEIVRPRPYRAVYRATIENMMTSNHDTIRTKLWEAAVEAMRPQRDMLGEPLIIEAITVTSIDARYTGVDAITDGYMVRLYDVKCTVTVDFWGNFTGSPIAPAVLAVAAAFAKIIVEVLLIILVAWIVGNVVKMVLESLNELARPLPPIIPPVAPEVFPCPYCDYEAESSEALAAHIASVHEKQKFVCPYCDPVVMFDSKAELDEHIETFHVGEPSPWAGLIEMAPWLVLAGVAFVAIKELR